MKQGHNSGVVGSVQEFCYYTLLPLAGFVLEESIGESLKRSLGMSLEESIGASLDQSLGKSLHLRLTNE